MLHIGDYEPPEQTEESRAEFNNQKNEYLGPLKERRREKMEAFANTERIVLKGRCGYAPSHIQGPDYQSVPFTAQPNPAMGFMVGIYVKGTWTNLTRSETVDLIEYLQDLVDKMED